MKCPLKFSRYEFEGGTDCIGAECGFYGCVCDMDSAVSVKECPNELSEGDAVNMLRKYVEERESANGKAGTHGKRLLQIADMVERDYVSRESIEGVMDTDRELVAENIRLRAERDELKSRHCPHYHVDRHYCDVHETRINELIAERDEWKARAEHVGATCDNSGGFVTHDSREKLDAEVRKWCGMYAYQADMVWVWLNRQAAITERHWMEIVGATLNANIKLKRQIDELQARVDELTEELRESNAERERLRECLGIATDHAHDFQALVDESGNVYDYDEGLA